MTGAAGAHPATVVVEMDVVLFCHLQYGYFCRYMFY
jgi:hypothetical protein